MTIKKTASGMLLVLALLFLASPSAHAQLKKGDKEVQGFSSGFSITQGGSTRIGDLNGSGFFSSSFRSGIFSLGGELGYFLTRRHEVGGSLFFTASHYKSCFRSFDNGQVSDEICDSDSNAGLGLSGFYSYNFGRDEAKGFPFVGGSIGVASVSDNFAGNFRAQPYIGYKYFVKKSVALDFSVGYSIELNKARSTGLFIRDRENSIYGRLGLSFVF